VEHIVPRRATHFHPLEELGTFMVTTLPEDEPEP